jgi:AcrR family transcriptional regulator
MQMQRVVAEAARRGGTAEAAAEQVRRLIDANNLGGAWHASHERIFCAALEMFAEYGFSGTSTRTIASQAGMSPGALYSHYESKEDILYRIIALTHEGMLRQLQLTMLGESDPGARLRALVASHVRYHAEMYIACRVANYELHCLHEDRLVEVMQLRHLIEATVRDSLLLAEGAKVSHVGDVHLATLMVISLGIDVSRWFRPGGGVTPDELADYYSDRVATMFAID